MGRIAKLSEGMDPKYDDMVPHCIMGFLGELKKHEYQRTDVVNQFMVDEKKAKGWVRVTKFYANYYKADNALVPGWTINYDHNSPKTDAEMIEKIKKVSAKLNEDFVDLNKGIFTPEEIDEMSIAELEMLLEQKFGRKRFPKGGRPPIMKLVYNAGLIDSDKEFSDLFNDMGALIY